MTPSEKRHLLTPNFQIEVPVPFGVVVRADAQGDTAWDYELVVSAPVAVVAQWYQQAYVAREWSLTKQSTPSTGAVALTYVKNRAQTRITISQDAGGGSHIEAVLGVGTAVLQTQ